MDPDWNYDTDPDPDAQYREWQKNNIIGLGRTSNAVNKSKRTDIKYYIQS